ncbi:fumarylacetoacetate hydrolase family protein [Herbiconiux sp. UC225_62]|uniref:fumarylacetoacetate hydrolase family protein n=1 Tax=Herbiconiux sp. UC225_62 TaxID=3350168 RepID=UPI0036D3C92D
MRYARQRVVTPDGITTRVIVSTDGGTTWLDLRRGIAHLERTRGATDDGARRFASTTAPGSLSGCLAGGSRFTDLVAQVVEEAAEVSLISPGRFANALDPASYRDYMVFEEHFSFGYRWQGKPVPEVMYELPVNYAGDPLSFIGPDDVIPWPNYTQRLDYELELGIVVGRSGRNLQPKEALDHVLGLTILNDVSARDIQGREMTGGLGPSKGKHFACVTGPVVTTLDELPPALRMRAKVNGELLCDTTSDQMVWSVAEIVAWASQGETLAPGALLGSGTCNGGSTIELDRRLEPGDEIELIVEGLGALRNRVGQPESDGWTPNARTRREDGTATSLRFLD